MIYAEGILWYLFLIDCLIYNILTWTKKRWHNQFTHWVSEHFPLHKFFGFWYLFLILWLGHTLYRMQLLGFYFG